MKATDLLTTNDALAYVRHGLAGFELGDWGAQVLNARITLAIGCVPASKPLVTDYVRHHYSAWPGLMTPEAGDLLSDAITDAWYLVTRSTNHTLWIRQLRRVFTGEVPRRTAVNTFQFVHPRRQPDAKRIKRDYEGRPWVKTGNNTGAYMRGLVFPWHPQPE